MFNKLVTVSLGSHEKTYEREKLLRLRYLRSELQIYFAFPLSQKSSRRKKRFRKFITFNILYHFNSLLTLTDLFALW